MIFKEMKRENPRGDKEKKAKLFFWESRIGLNLYHD